MLLRALSGLFRHTDSQPPKVDPTIIVTGLDVLDDEETHLETKDPLNHQESFSLPSTNSVSTQFNSVDDDIFGITTVIEYIDSKNAFSRRRVTLRNITCREDGRFYVNCICHERNALRSFRFDRIQSVIDLDGEIHQPLAFFRDELQIRVDLSGAHVSEMTGLGAMEPRVALRREPDDAIGKEKPGAAQRRIARDGTRLLVGLARADGNLDPAEVNVVLDYIEAICRRSMVAFDDEDRRALSGYVKRVRPSSEVLDGCLGRIQGAPIDEQKLFIRYASALAEADGVIDEAEFHVLLEIKETLL